MYILSAEQQHRRALSISLSQTTFYSISPPVSRDCLQSPKKNEYFAQKAFEGTQEIPELQLISQMLFNMWR